MAKDTKRDQVWRAVIELCDDPNEYWTPSPGDYGEEYVGFTKPDIRQHIEVEVSNRTVHDVVRTAEQYGIIEVVNPYETSVNHAETGDFAQMNVYAQAGGSAP